MHSSNSVIPSKLERVHSSQSHHQLGVCQKLHPVYFMQAVISQKSKHLAQTLTQTHRYFIIQVFSIKQYNTKLTSRKNYELCDL